MSSDNDAAVAVIEAEMEQLRIDLLLAIAESAKRFRLSGWQGGSILYYGDEKIGAMLLFSERNGASYYITADDDLAVTTGGDNSCVIYGGALKDRPVGWMMNDPGIKDFVKGLLC